MTEKKQLTRLEVFRELDKRGGLDKQHQDELFRLEAGDFGERTVLKYIEKFGEPHWITLRNIWFDHYGVFECDLILVTRIGVQMFEIKNYSGVYEFKNSQCIRDGQKIGHNAISQAQKSLIQLQSLLQRNGYTVEVGGAIVFTGEHYDVKVYDEVADLEVVKLNQLRDFVWQIAKQERESFNRRINTDQLVRFIEKVKVETPFPPEPITNEMSARLRKGILCSHCGSFDVEIGRTSVSCNCGMVEPRENAIVRTICEYGVIHFDKNLVTNDVLEFFNGQISRTNLLDHLKKYFKRLAFSKSTVFDNKRALFEDIFKSFRLVGDRILHISRY